MVSAAAPMERKPSSAEAIPASLPKGPMVIAVPSGLARPMPHRKVTIERAYHPRPGAAGPTRSRLPPIMAQAMPASVMIRAP
ncbi:hypothetical protein D3C84_1216130 [compost metagenome]